MGPCPFLKDHSCSVNEKKPYECKMYPFMVSRLPLTKSDGSHFDIDNRVYYVYVSPKCEGLGVGDKLEKTIEKIIELWKSTEKKESFVTRHK